MLLFIPVDRLHANQVDDARRSLPRRRSAAGSDTGLAPRRSRTWSTTRRKSAPARSILLTKIMRGTLYLLPWRQTVSVCGSTPPTEHSTVTAPSSTRRLRSTSIVKSTWPGVSMMLTRCSSYCCPCPPETGRRSRRDRDAALLLLLHPVHDGSAVVHLAYLVRDTGVEKDALGRGRLARINMGHDADIAVTLDGGCAGHDKNPVTRSAETDYQR